MMNFREDLIAVEYAIANLKENIDIESSCNTICSKIANIIGYSPDHVKVSISKNVPNIPFVVNIFSSNASCATIQLVRNLNQSMNMLDGEGTNVENNFMEEWFESNNNTILIELDSMILNNAFSPKEITAAILFELYRILYTTTIPKAIFDELYKRIKSSDPIIGVLLAHRTSSSIIPIIAYTGTISKQFVIADNCRCSNDEESSECPHKFLKMLDYDDAYNAFISKSIEKLGTSLIYKTDADVCNEIKMSIIWFIDIIHELKYNKKKLKDTVKTEILAASSDRMKITLNNILKTFFGKNTDRYREILSENWNDTPVDKYTEEFTFSAICKEHTSIVTEAKDMFLDKHGKVKKVTQLDIDVIAVDVDRITTHDEKIYLLDRIYDKLHLIEAGLEYIESGQKDKVYQSKNTLTDLKRQLEDLRAQVLATRIIEKDYGVFVRYPKGYEG